MEPVGFGERWRSNYLGGLQLALTGVFRASGKMLAAMMLVLISQWVLQFPLAYVLSTHTSLGATSLWWAFPISNATIAIVTVLWFLKGDWKKTKLTEEQDFAEAVGRGDLH